MPRSQIADLIRRYRGDYKLTQVALASLMDVTQGTVSRWEKGRQLPDHQQFSRLTRLIGSASVPGLPQGAVAVEQGFNLRLLVEADGRVLCGSRSLARLLGRSLMELRGLDLSAVLDEPGAVFLRQVFTETQASGQMPTLCSRAKLLGVSGEWHPVLLRVLPYVLGHARVAVLAEIEFTEMSKPCAARASAARGEDGGLSDHPALRENVILAPPIELVQSRILGDFYRRWMYQPGDPCCRPRASRLDLSSYPNTVRQHLHTLTVVPDGRIWHESAGVCSTSGCGGQFIDEMPRMEETVIRLRHLVRTGTPYLCRLAQVWGKGETGLYDMLSCPLFDDSGEQVVAVLAAVVRSAEEGVSKSTNVSRQCSPSPGNAGASVAPGLGDEPRGIRQSL